jgi:tetraacyldisaccharide 4'-kinase
MSAAWSEAVSGCLAPLAWVYEAGVRARNRRFDRPGAERRAGLPVLSVGNLVVGGTGKTPTVSWLASRLLALGLSPAIVSRGYGGRAGRGPLVVSTGAGPTCTADSCGDEPFLLATATRGAIVIVGADRAAGAERARGLGASAVLLDDGFQHRALARDLDIVLLDAARPFGNGRLLPAGPLREPLDSLRRADVVLLTRARDAADPTDTSRVVAALRPGTPLVRSSFRRVGFVDATGVEVPGPRRAVAFCGIARPDTFRTELAGEPTEIVSFRVFADHHRFTDREIDELLDAAARAGARLVTTEKDLARLSSRTIPRESAPIALRIELVVHEPEPLLDAIERAIGRRAA